MFEALPDASGLRTLYPRSDKAAELSAYLWRKNVPLPSGQARHSDFARALALGMRDGRPRARRFQTRQLYLFPQLHIFVDAILKILNNQSVRIRRLR